MLLDYFKKAYDGLKDEGAFFVDIFGGTECRQELVEETDRGKFTYFWDCDNYDPVTSEVQYYIHFKTHKTIRSISEYSPMIGECGTFMKSKKSSKMPGLTMSISSGKETMTTVGEMANLPE